MTERSYQMITEAKEGLGESNNGDASIVNHGIVRWFDVFVFSRTCGKQINCWGLIWANGIWSWGLGLSLLWWFTITRNPRWKGDYYLGIYLKNQASTTRDEAGHDTFLPFVAFSCVNLVYIYIHTHLAARSALGTDNNLDMITMVNGGFFVATAGRFFWFSIPLFISNDHVDGRNSWIECTLIAGFNVTCLEFEMCF